VVLMDGTKTAAVRSVVTVRRAAPGDEWAIRRLFGDLHAFNTSLESKFALADGWERLLTEQLRQERVTQGSVTLVAWDGAAPVGLAMIGAHLDSPLFRHRAWAELTALHVVPEARGSGVAELLMEAGLAWARERGFGEIRLYVTAANERARRFYTRAGLHPLQEIWSADIPAVDAFEEWSGDEAVAPAA
jgi:GNAT superfamily N-acetyltransferase